MKYQVATFRDAGLEAKWKKTGDGQPYIAVRDPNADTEHQRVQWWVCDASMFKAMIDKGVKAGFNQATVLGNFFSIGV